MNNIRNRLFLEKFGKHIRSLREDKGMSMEQLSYECDIELSQIYRIEKGKINCTISTLKVLAEGLQMEIADLVQFK